MFFGISSSLSKTSVVEELSDLQKVALIADVVLSTIAAIGAVYALLSLNGVDLAALNTAASFMGKEGLKILVGSALGCLAIEAISLIIKNCRQASLILEAHDQLTQSMMLPVDRENSEYTILEKKKEEGFWRQKERSIQELEIGNRALNAKITKLDREIERLQGEYRELQHLSDLKSQNERALEKLKTEVEALAALRNRLQASKDETEENAAQEVTQLQPVASDSKKEERKLRRLNSLQDVRHPLMEKPPVPQVALRKHTQRRAEWRRPIERTGNLDPSYLSTLFKSATKPIKETFNYLMGGSNLQQRGYYYLLSSLFDPLFSFFGMNILKSAPQLEKINTLIFNLNQNYWAEFKFLVDLDACKNECQVSLHLAFQQLILTADPNQNFSVVRNTFFVHLNEAYKNEEYQSHIAHFRSITKEEGKEKARKTYPVIALMQNLGFAVFTGMNFNHYAQEAVFSVFQEGQNKVGFHSQEDVSLSEMIKEDHDSIDRVKAEFKGGAFFKGVNQLQGHANVNFAPLQNNNFSSVYWRSHYRLGETSVTPTCLRFGTPTTENWDDPEVIPTMYLFLDYCVREGLRVVSFQHQNPKPKGVLKGDESKRLKKMFDISRNPVYRDAYIVFGFPQDGDFFKQTGKYVDASYATSQIFIEEFLKQLIPPNQKSSSLSTEEPSLIQIPPDILKKNFPKNKEEFEKILSFVQKAFFSSASSMTQLQRQIFQLIAYAHLIEYFSVGLRADFFHCQCKDAQDRAIVLVATLYYLSMIRQGKEKDPEELRKLRTHIEFACLMIKGMSLHEHRFSLLHATLDHLSHLSEAEKKVIRDTPLFINGEPCTLDEILVEDVPNQSLYRLPSEALDEKEYMELLTKDVEFLEQKIQKGEGVGCKFHLFVQKFFSHTQLEKEIENLVMQFRVHDVPRQHYLFEGQKLQLLQFEEKLKALALEQQFEKELKKYDNNLLDQIVAQEKIIVDPFCFCLYLKSLENAPLFASACKKLYHELRADALEKNIEDWLGEDKGNLKKILALSQQGTLSDVVCMLEQRYRYVTEINLEHLSTKKTDHDKVLILQVLQRDPTRELIPSANTCFNYLTTKRGDKLIEAYQLFELSKGMEKETLYYITTITHINLKTGHADVSFMPPRKQKPQDITRIVLQANRSIDSLADSFLDLGTSI